MDFFIRQMKPGEEAEIRDLGRKAFKGFESLFIPKPKNALVAINNEKIIAAVIYKIYRVGTRKIGHIDFGFVDPEAQGLSAGHRLYEAATDLLWEQGCDYCSAVVKDDNVGSWHLLIQKGYQRISLPQMVKELGIGDSLRQYFGTSLSVAVGMEYYLAKKDGQIQMSKDHSWIQMLTFLLINVTLGVVMAFTRGYNPLDMMIALSVIFAGVIVFGFIGTRLSREKDWQYRTMDGGLFIHGLPPIFGGFFPAIGNWYPKTYRKAADFKRALGLSAIFQWSYLILLKLIASIYVEMGSIPYLINLLASIVLVLHSIPFYPAESYSAGRVYRWHKGIYLAMAVVTIFVIAM